MSNQTERMLGEIVNWLDSNNGCGEDERLLRIMKIGEEFGKVVSAVIGQAGHDSRTGVTHSVIDVTRGLADVIIATLVAMESLGYNSSRYMERHIAAVHSRILRP